MGSSLLTTIKTTLGKHYKFLRIIMMKLMIICLTLAAISEVNGANWKNWKNIDVEKYRCERNGKKFLIGMTMQQANRFIKTHDIGISEISHDTDYVDFDYDIKRLNVVLRNGRIVVIEDCA